MEAQTHLLRLNIISAGGLSVSPVGWPAGGGPSFHVRMLVIPRAFELSAAAPNFLKKVAPQIQFTWLLSFEPPGRRVGESGEFLVRWTS